MSSPTDKPQNTTVPAASSGAPASAPAQAPRPQGQRPFGTRPPYQGGPRPGGPGGDNKGGGFRGRGPRRPPMRRKVCRFCVEKVREVDYKAVHVLRSFMTLRGKILSGRSTGTCAKHQRQVTMAVKRAQNIALLPIVGE